MKTPIQKIIIKLSQRINDTPMNNAQSRRARGAYTDALLIVKSYLEEEKGSLCDAWQDGKCCERFGPGDMDGEQFYKETYDGTDN